MKIIINETIIIYQLLIPMVKFVQWYERDNDVKITMNLYLLSKFFKHIIGIFKSTIFIGHNSNK